MADEQELAIIKEIAQNYASTIDLEKSPLVLVEIIRNYGPRFGVLGPNPFGTSVQGGTTGVNGVNTNPGSGGSSGGVNVDVNLADIMRGILHLQRSVSLLGNQIQTILSQGLNPVLPPVSPTPGA